MTQTIAKKFQNDADVIAAKKTLVQKLSDYQRQLNHTQGPKDELKASYEETLKAFEAIRGGNLYIPYLSSGLGHGPFVELGDGSVKYDFIIGIGVHHFGHSHPKIIEACLDAALSDTVMQGNLQQDLKSESFSELLLKTSQKNGAKLEHCFLTSSGVMAGENALKMAFQKHEPAARVLAFENCFMGRTIVMSNTTDNPAYRVGLPKVVNVDYLPFFDQNDPDGSTKKALHTLEALLKKHPDQYAAMSFELILGEGGFYPGDKTFFRKIMEVLKANNIAILVDEVQSFARTTEPFAFQHFELDDLVDIVWIGKASQACATFFTDAYKPKPGLLSQTYTASSTAIAAGEVIVSTMLNDNYFGKDGKIMTLHNHFVSKLKDLAQKHPDKITGPYGIGAMIAFTPFGGNPDVVKKFVRHLYDKGVIGFICGKNPLRVRFLLPVGAIETKHIDDVVEILQTAFNEFDPQS